MNNSSPEYAPKPMGILIADNHPMVREGLTALFASQPDMTVVAQAADGAEAVALYRCFRPDVALMDARMPLMDGIEAFCAIREEHAAARVVLFSAYGGDEEIYRALEAGVKSYLLKTATREEILAVMRAVHQGETLLLAPVAQKLAERTLYSDLTAREHAVLHRIVAGQSNSEIGLTLGISEGTVKSHVNHILHKMRVVDRTQASMAALKRGMVRLE